MPSVGERELELYLAEMQRIQMYVDKQSPLGEMFRRHMADPLYYQGVAEQAALIGELQAYLIELTRRTGDRGRLMAAKAMTKYLEKAERRYMSQRELRALDLMSTRNVERRMALYTRQLLREGQYAQAQIDEFVTQAAISGRSPRQVVGELVKAAANDRGIAAGFEKRVNRVAIDAARREAQAQSFDAYLRVADPSDNWRWVTVSSGPCPDCRARAGKVLPLERWRDLGLPGTGRTVCGAACMCQLGPVSVFNELFPDAKQYDFDREKLVLTTAREARTLESKAASGG